MGLTRELFLFVMHIEIRNNLNYTDRQLRLQLKVNWMMEDVSRRHVACV